MTKIRSSNTKLYSVVAQPNDEVLPNNKLWSEQTHELANNDQISLSKTDYVISKNDYVIEHLLDEGYNNIESVPGLKTLLYSHQKVIVRNMIDIENNSKFDIISNNMDITYKTHTNAAVLSEKVGSGKTFDILSLIMIQPTPNKSTHDIDYIVQNRMYGRSKWNNVQMLVKKKFSFVLKPTLIFVGSSVLRQWANTIKNFTNLKTFVVIGIREFELLINKIINKSVNEYDIILIKNGSIVRPIIPDNINLLPINQNKPHMYSLLANIRDACWSRVVIDDFDTINLKEGSLVISSLFTWYVSSTKKHMKQSLQSKINADFNDVGSLVSYGNFPIGNTSYNSLLYYNCNLRNNPSFVKKTSELPTPKFYAYCFKNPNARLIGVMNTLSGEMREVVEMINADAIETAAERLGIKTTTTAGIFEKILGDQYKNMLVICNILKFINEQKNKIRQPWLGKEIHGTYGVRELEKFEEILYEYPNIDQFLIEQYAKYSDRKDKAMNTLNRIKDHITEGECPICIEDIKEECGGKVVIFKCCSVIICEPCCFNTIFYRKIATSCPNCRREISLRDLVYISQEINLDDVIKDVEQGNLNSGVESEKVEAGCRPVIKKDNYGKYDAIVDIILGNKIDNQEEIQVNIPQLMTGSAKLPEAKVRKVLVFANYPETLNKIQKKFVEEDIKYERLGGTAKQISEIVDRFANGEDNNVLLICAAQYCAGLNLQMATDLIFAHLIIDQHVETQVAGRLIRLGRTTSANFHYVMFEEEYNQKMEDHRVSRINKSK
jgi:SNF2 family DNA or RNA helicase